MKLGKVKAITKAVLSGTIGIRKVLGSRPLRTGIRLLGKKGVRSAMGLSAYGYVVPTGVAAGAVLLKKKCPKGQKYSKKNKKCY